MPEPELVRGWVLRSADDTIEVGQQLAHAVSSNRPDRLVIHLIGDLGAGKTTFVRGVLRGFGYAGRVPSPTYTLVEPYEMCGYSICHVDLYRLIDRKEARFLGLEDACAEQSLLLVEWPERAVGIIEPPDLRVVLEIDGNSRRLSLCALNPKGAGIVAACVALMGAPADH